MSDMIDLENLKTEVDALKERNKRVEADKAWETSNFRRFLIVLVTYIIALAALYAIGNNKPYLNALIPAIGYFLSTLSLPFIKSWWLKNKLRNG